jgi:replicative DNA helicase
MESAMRGSQGHPARKIEPAIIAGRVPPHDLDAEAAVLSAILLSRDALDRVLELLKPEHFYSDANGRIFDAMMQLAAAGTPIDIVSVASYLRDRERLAHVGGPTYLGQLADATPAVAHVGAHAQVVHEKWRLRALIATCQRVAAEGYGDVGDPQLFVDSAEQAIYELSRTVRRKTGATMWEAINQSFRQIMAAVESGGGVTGVSTGFAKIDARTAGLHSGELMIVAARPGMGKSSLVLDMTRHASAPRRVVAPGGAETVLPGHGVVIFSLEMPTPQVARRMTCSESRVDVGRARTGKLDRNEMNRLIDAGEALKTRPVFIEDAPLGLLELRARVRRHQADYDRAATATTPAQKIRVVVVDYLQLMQTREGLSRHEALGEITRGLKRLAKELDVAVICLSQLNRSVESRNDKRPLLSDLRESGNIEEDADVVAFVFRDEYYTREKSKLHGIAEVDFAKIRDGQTGRVFLRYTASCTSFDNLAVDPDEEHLAE